MIATRWLTYLTGAGFTPAGLIDLARPHSPEPFTAMEAKVTDKLWSLEDVVALIPEPVVKKRGKYKTQKD